MESPATANPPAAPAPTLSDELVIEARRGWQPIHWGDLWRYRDLLRLLAARDVRVRYKQTLIGVGWAVLQPLLTMTIFAIFFGKLAKMPSDGVPYTLFALAALTPWQLFSHALTASSNSLIENERLVTKVYFPRIIIPLASVVAGVVDFFVALTLLLILALALGITPTWRIIAVPPLLLLTIATALAVGLWLAALNTLYRDFRYTLPFIAQVWLFASPVAYPSSLVPEAWRWLYGLNPMAGVIEGFRWALLGTSPSIGSMFLVSIVVTLLLLYCGAVYFRRMERLIADRI